MTREEALAEKYVSRSELINKIYNDHKTQLKQRDEEIERLKEKIHRLENDSIVLNMEQRLIDIGLVLDGKLTSKNTKWNGY